MEQLSMWSVEHISNVIASLLNYSFGNPISVSLEEFDGYSPETLKQILLSLDWMATNKECSTFSMWLQKKRKMPAMLMAEHHPIGTILIHDNILSARINESSWILNQNSLVEYSSGQIMDLSYLLHPASMWKNFLLDDSGENYLDFSAFEIQEQAGIMVSLFRANDNSSFSKDKRKKFFPYSIQGIHAAADYAKTAIMEQKNVMSASLDLFTLQPYQAGYSGATTNNALLYTLSNTNIVQEFYAPAWMNPHMQEWAENNQHKFYEQQPNSKLMLGHKDTVDFIDRTITLLQNIIYDNMEEIKNYALSHPFHQNEKFHLLFNSSLYKSMPYSSCKNEYNEIHLDWGDIPSGAVQNAYRALNRIQMLKMNPVELICVPFYD